MGMATCARRRSACCTRRAPSCLTITPAPTLTLTLILIRTLPLITYPKPGPNQARTLVPTLLLPAFGAPAASHTVEWTLCLVAALVPLVLRLGPGLWHVV